MAASANMLRHRFDVNSVETFCRSLEDFGSRAMPLFKGKVESEMKQFVAAAIVSHFEIENKDFSFMQEAERQLQEAFTTKNILNIYENYSLSFNRLVVLMNTPEPKRHGEARLLDPDGKIKSVLSTDSDINFLDKLRKMFPYDCRHNEYIICIFSLYIPCTETEHQCAKLIDTFVQQNNTEVIVAYKTVFRRTNLDEARTVLNNNDKIYCLHLDELKSSNPPSKTKSSNRPLAYNGTTYDAEIGLSNSRMAKQARKGRKAPYPSVPTEKKKRRSYTRKKSDDS